MRPRRADLQVMIDLTATAVAQPGWYQDPLGKPQVRWWDGKAWTTRTRPHQFAAEPVAALTVPEPIAAPVGEPRAPASAIEHRPTPASNAHTGSDTADTPTNTPTNTPPDAASDDDVPGPTASTSNDLDPLRQNPYRLGAKNTTAPDSPLILQARLDLASGTQGPRWHRLLMAAPAGLLLVTIALALVIDASSPTHPWSPALPIAFFLLVAASAYLAVRDTEVLMDKGVKVNSGVLLGVGLGPAGYLAARAATLPDTSKEKDAWSTAVTGVAIQIGAVVLAFIACAVLAPNEAKIDPDAIAREIAADINKQIPNSQPRVTCPPETAVAPGTKFRCTLQSLRSEQPLNVTVTIQDKAGAYTWDVATVTAD